jgi:hypothetical protein
MWRDYKREISIFLFGVAILLLIVQYWQIQACMADPYCSIDFWYWHKEGYNASVQLSELFP